MGCTLKCWAMPDCAVCGMRKHPSGRDPGVYAYSDYCAYECEGHSREPYAGHFWPGEEPDMYEAAKQKAANDGTEAVKP